MIFWRHVIQGRNLQVGRRSQVADQSLGDLVGASVLGEFLPKNCSWFSIMEPCMTGPPGRPFGTAEFAMDRSVSPLKNHPRMWTFLELFAPFHGIYVWSACVRISYLSYIQLRSRGLLRAGSVQSPFHKIESCSIQCQAKLPIGNPSWFWPSLL